MAFAKQAAQKSKDTTKVGAVLVDPYTNAVLLPTFNGPPIDIIDTDERRERPVKYLFNSHAEENLIAFAARMGVRTLGATVYTTHLPCATCARMMIQAGIRCVVYGEGTFQALDEQKAATMAMFNEARVIVERYSEEA